MGAVSCLTLIATSGLAPKDLHHFFGHAGIPTESPDRVLSWDQFELRQGFETAAMASRLSTTQTQPPILSCRQRRKKKKNLCGVASVISTLLGSIRCLLFFLLSMALAVLGAGGWQDSLQH